MYQYAALQILRRLCVREPGNDSAWMLPLEERRLRKMKDEAKKRLRK
jgi:hypothetical protein